MLAKAKNDLSQGMRDVMTRKLYETPDYAVYSVQPTDHHPQVEIRYEHRYAAVDERIAPLVLEAWKRGWETMGSCQERPPDSKHAGQAYLDFPDPAHGRKFAAALRVASIAVEEGVTGLLLSSRRPNGFVTCHFLGKMLVFLPSVDIERATAALQSG